MERLKEGMLAAHEGLEPRAGRDARARGALRRDRPVRVPGGPRPHGAAPQRRPAHLHRVELARGGRASAAPALRRERRHRHPGRDRRRRPVHGRARVLRLRRAEGRGDPDLAGRLGIDLDGLVRLQRFDHRPADALGRRAPGRGQPRPRAPPRGRGARVAGARLPPPGSVAHAHRAGRAAAQAVDRGGRRRRRGRRRARLGRAALRTHRTER